MLNFANQSLHRRLTMLLFLVAGAVFLSSYLAFLTYERSALRQNMVRNLRTQALVLSDAIAADLDFGGTLNNIKSMKFLATNKHILAARLFDEVSVLPSKRGRKPSCTYPSSVHTPLLQKPPRSTGAASTPSTVMPSITRRSARS